MLTLKFTIPGRPVTKKNHGRRVKRGRKIFNIPSEAYEKWNGSADVRSKNFGGAQLSLRKQLDAYNAKGVFGPFNGEANMAAVIYRGARVGDLINYLQAVQDALQEAGAIVDDKMIVTVDGSRLDLDLERPRVEVTLSFLTI